MADEFQVGSGNWWDSSSRIPSSSAMDSGAPPVSGSSNILMFQETQKRLQPPDSTSSILTADSDMQLMGLGLSSHQSIDWSSNLLRDRGKAESSGFRSMLQEDDQLRSAPSFYHHHQEQWRQPKIYSGPGADSEDSTGNDFKQTNLGFSLDNQPHFNSSATEVAASYPSDPTVGYGSPSTILLQGLLASDQDNRQQSTLASDYPFPTNYDLNSGEMMSAPPWSKFPQFMRNSPPSHQPQPQLQFSNTTSFWNSPVNNDGGRPGFFQSVQPPPPYPPPPTFEEKPKINPLEDRDLGSASGKRNNNYSNTTEGSSYKRARTEATPSPLPAFKVRKEKMGDRITALQQLVSPFGKTDTASVLSEAIEYIKFLHEQVSVLSSPYMKIGVSMQQQQQHEISLEKSKVENDGGKAGKDLKSLGLCLVPVSSTFPVIHEQTVDYWNPTFGGSFR